MTLVIHDYTLLGIVTICLGFYTMIDGVGECFGVIIGGSLALIGLFLVGLK